MQKANEDCEKAEPVRGGGDSHKNAPALKSVKIGTLTSSISFLAESPLRCTQNKATGFYVYDERGVFYPAQAQIVSDYVVHLAHKGLRNPMGVGYADFHYGNIGNLTDGKGNAVPPFRFGAENPRVYEPVLAMLLSERKIACELDCGEHITVKKESASENVSRTAKREKHAWHGGDVFSSDKANVRMASGEPRLFFDPDPETDYMCGISPELNAPFQNADLSPYEALKIKFKTNADLTFSGMHFITSCGKLCLCVPVSEFGRGDIAMSSGTNIITLDLTCPVDLSCGEINRTFLSRIRSLQFSFRARTSGSVRICQIDYFRNLTLK